MRVALSAMMYWVLAVTREAPALLVVEVLVRMFGVCAWRRGAGERRRARRARASAASVAGVAVGFMFLEMVRMGWRGVRCEVRGGWRGASGAREAWEMGRGRVRRVRGKLEHERVG